MTVQIFTNKDFEHLSMYALDNWLKFNRNQLIGSAVFTKNNSIVSKIVSWAEHFKCSHREFIPSHTGSIIWYKDDLYLFNMKPLKSSVISLREYLFTTTDTYELVMRDFDLDTKMFSANVAEHIGEFYPFMSAIRSVFTKRQSKWRNHCSELHLRELQKQGILTFLNPEITPDELYHVLLEDKQYG